MYAISTPFSTVQQLIHSIRKDVVSSQLSSHNRYEREFFVHPHFMNFLFGDEINELIETVSSKK